MFRVYYTGVSRFKSRLWYRLWWKRLLWFYSVPWIMCHVKYLNWAAIASFPVLFRFFSHQASYPSSLIASLKTIKTNTTVTYVSPALFPLRHFHRIAVVSTTSQQKKKQNSSLILETNISWTGGKKVDCAGVKMRSDYRRQTTSQYSGMLVG